MTHPIIDGFQQNINKILIRNTLLHTLLLRASKFSVNSREVFFPYELIQICESDLDNGVKSY